MSKKKKSLEMKKCVVCGKEFMPIRGNQVVCCEDCRRERDRELQKQWQENNKGNMNKKTAQEMPKKEKRKTEKPERTEPKSNHEKIAEIAIEARKQGMSYGQYVALMHMKGEQK